MVFKGFRMKLKLEFCFPERFASWAKLNHQLTERRMKENTSRSLFSSPASPWVPIQKISNTQWRRLSCPASTDVINLSDISLRRQPWQPVSAPPTASGCTGETSSRGHAAHIFHLTVFFWGGVGGGSPHFFFPSISAAAQRRNEGVFIYKTVCLLSFLSFFLFFNLSCISYNTFPASFSSKPKFLKI